ncbi:unnamed protein product [Ectocarpus fasciculatus]
MISYPSLCAHALQRTSLAAAWHAQTQGGRHAHPLPRPNACTVDLLLQNCVIGTKLRSVLVRNLFNWHVGFEPNDELRTTTDGHFLRSLKQVFILPSLVLQQ